MRCCFVVQDSRQEQIGETLRRHTIGDDELLRAQTLIEKPVHDGVVHDCAKKHPHRYQRVYFAKYAFRNALFDMRCQLAKPLGNMVTKK